MTTLIGLMIIKKKNDQNTDLKNKAQLDCPIT